MSEWQTIESAPKDGEVILVCDPRVRNLVCAAAWVEREYSEPLQKTGWFKRQEKRRWTEGGWEAVSPGRDLGRWIALANVAMLEPTHWMPLPDAPDKPAHR